MTLLPMISIFTVFVIALTLSFSPVLTSASKIRNQFKEKDKQLSSRDLGPIEHDFSLSSIRFSKIQFKHPKLAKLLGLPLTNRDYPISSDVATILRLSMCPSVTTTSDPEVRYNIEELIDDIGGLPSHPSSNQSNPYWDQLKKVIEIQKKRMEDDSSPARAVMPLPKLWEGYSLYDVAEAVNDEFPGTHQTELVKSILSKYADDLKIDNEVIPKRSESQFLHGTVMLAELTTWSNGVVGPYCFASKYYAGRCRPEELVWAIYEGILDENDGIPVDIADDVGELQLSNINNFTAYTAGSPMHPSWPAMHSCVSTTSLWLAVVLNLKPEERCQAMLTDYAVSFGRTVAGVHYPDDNIAGLKLGQEIIARELPILLAYRFGSNEANVINKINRVRFDWDNFDPINGC